MLDFIRRQLAALKASAWLTFAEIVRWQRTQRPKNLVPRYSGGRLWHPPSPPQVQHGCISAQRNQSGLELAPEQTSWIFCCHLSHKGSCSGELTCLPHLPAHTAKPIFPRQHGRTAWWDTGLEAGGCFKQIRMIWQCRLIWDVYFEGESVIRSFCIQIVELE